ncbi:hypothetical protein ABIB25_005694 [Nakamurella sp. UYEF19]
MEILHPTHGGPRLVTMADGESCAVFSFWSCRCGHKPQRAEINDAPDPSEYSIGSVVIRCPSPVPMAEPIG